MQKLSQLFDLHGSDKGLRTGDCHNYGSVYGALFEGLRPKKIRLLELGVFKGSSICAWLEYFPEGEIYGVDFRLEQQLGNDVPLSNKRLHLFQGDVTDPLVVPDLEFNIIIDDSNHTTDTQVQTLLAHWPKLIDGGYYIIEDLFVGRLPWGGKASVRSKSFLWPYAGFSRSPRQRFFPKHPQDLFFLNRAHMSASVSKILDENQYFFTISSVSSDGGLHMMLVIRRQSL
jgi:hypothetical protein